MIKKMLKPVLTILLLFLFKWFKINILYLIGIEVKTTSLIYKSKLDGHITLKNGTAIFSSDIKGKYKTGENSKILKSVLSGNITNYKNVNIEESNINGTVSIGNNSKLYQSTLNGKFYCDENVKIIGPGVIISGNINIGRYTSLNGPNLDIISKINKISIGCFCSIARSVSIQEYNHHVNRISSYFVNKNIFGDETSDITSKGDIIIEHDVWIGAQSVILSGSHISTGAIVAANSVVTGFIPPYAIVGGSPAKVIKYRFNQATICSLLNSEWWNWSIKKITENKHLFKQECTSKTAYSLEIQNILPSK